MNVSKISVEKYIKASKEEEKNVMLQDEIDGVKGKLDDSVKEITSCPTS